METLFEFLTDHKLINRLQGPNRSQRVISGIQDPKFLDFLGCLLNKDCSLVNKTEFFINILVKKTIQVFRYPLILLQTQRHKRSSLLQVELHILLVSECTFSSLRFPLRPLTKHNVNKSKLKKNARGGKGHQPPR